MEELNKKIAEWCGFKGKLAGIVGVAGEKEGKLVYEIPDFTTSLDACFEYIVPKLEIATLDWQGGHYMVWVKVAGISYIASDNSPALALCRAVEKLIDGECKHNFVNVVNKAIPEPGLDVCTKCGKLG